MYNIYYTIVVKVTHWARVFLGTLSLYVLQY